MYNIFLDYRSRSVCEECNTTRMLCGEYVLMKGDCGRMKRHWCINSLVNERLQVKYPASLWSLVSWQKCTNFTLYHLRSGKNGCADCEELYKVINQSYLAMYGSAELFAA